VEGEAVADELEQLIEHLRARYAALPPHPDARRDFLAHLRSLSRWHAEPQDYPVASDVAFPSAITVAFAVCHPECGAREFIVEGSTQECQACGSLMYRAERKSYRLERPTLDSPTSRGTA
jgi:hypothetical protein